MVNRIIQAQIQDDLEKKIVILTGPRQIGKTTLSRQLDRDYDYLNYDVVPDRQQILDRTWDRQKRLVIFDELHKLDKWKLFLKGVYDGDGIPPRLLVTGSARLDIFRRVGDSLAGRFVSYRLHPLDVREMLGQTSLSPDECVDQLMVCGNFPEPFLTGNQRGYRRWARSHIDVILRHDLIDLTTIHDIPKLELLVERLRFMVGSTISVANIARDLDKDPNTIKRWLQLLEDLYIIFKVTPYHHNIARSLLKDSKYYFYDTAQPATDGARLENLVACALQKKLDELEDCDGYSTRLHFLRTKDGKEIDFLTLVDNRPTTMIEVKQSDPAMSTSFNYFGDLMPKTKRIQLVKILSKNLTHPNGVRIEKLSNWLQTVSIDV